MIDGLDRAIQIVRRRLDYYRRLGQPVDSPVRAHPATIAALCEVLVFLKAERERATEMRKPQPRVCQFCDNRVGFGHTMCGPCSEVP